MGFVEQGVTMQQSGANYLRGGFGTAVVEPTPEGVNPYMVDGVNRAPELVPRICGTPERLAASVREGLVIRELGVEDAAARAGVPVEVVERAAGSGLVTLSDAWAVLDALGIDPVTLPAECLRLEEEQWSDEPGSAPRGWEQQP